MSRTTIDFGIDLGTTNSAIAMLRGVNTEIIKNNLGSDITPSAVYVDKRGQMQIGQRARDRIASFPEDAYIEFKRQMGLDQQYKFQSGGRTMRPEELSAEVLKSLRGDVMQQMQEELTSVVITVPAAFEQKQCAATRRAAELAGFTFSPLVQEPVAAALAYGFQENSEDAFWLVFDFGGGTFDAAVIRAEDGIISVVHHGGHNYLGGCDIDHAMIDQLIIPKLRKEYRLSDFDRSNPRWKKAFAVIKRAAEGAKIELSRTQEAYLEDCRFKDDRGEDIEVELSITRSELARVAEPTINEAVEICKRALLEKRLAPADLGKVILVGGPTLAPYFRDIVQEKLGIKPDGRVDPLTVVARGAAVFAATQRPLAPTLKQPPRTAFQVELSYSPVGAEADPLVRGTVRGTAGQNLEGFTVELVHEKNHWRSGLNTLRSDGKFRVRLRAERGDRNTFLLELLSPTGLRQEITPASIDYTIGLVITEQPVINSIGIGLIDNSIKEFFKKGSPLPARFTHIFRTAFALRKGNAKDMLHIPVLEGDNARADRNRLVGKLVIQGSSIHRDLQSGREIEVTLVYDESRQLLVKAYVPDLDEEFEVAISHDERVGDIALLGQEHERLLQRLDTLRQKIIETGDAEARSKLQEIESSAILRELQMNIAAARGDALAVGKAEMRLLEVQVKLDGVEDAVAWPVLAAEARAQIVSLQRELLNVTGDRSRGARMIMEAEETIRTKNPERLRKRISEMSELENEIIVSRPEFWVNYFRWLSSQRDQFSEPAIGDRLLDKGHHFLEKADVDGLRSICRQLRDLLPKETTDRPGRGPLIETGLQR